MAHPTATKKKTHGTASVRSSSYAERATAYARRVAAGSILASKWTRLACERHLKDLAESKRATFRWCFDSAKADAVCRFCELVPHEKGQLQGQPLKLEDWQCFIIANVFGWVDRRTGLRKYTEAFVLVPRGNGKSPLVARVGLWLAFFDKEGGAEVYCGAKTEKQAWEVFRPAKAIVEMVPPLRQKFGIQVAAKALTQLKSRSRFIPVVRRPGDGASIYGGLIDEFHEHLDSELYDAFKTGAVKRQQSLIFVISTAGSSIEGPCYDRQRDVEKVLEGILENERLFGIIYQADPEIEWTSREALVMANPNLGISNVEETLLQDQRAAAQNPAKQNIFRCKHLNQWMQATEAWMNMVAWNKCANPEMSEDDFADDACWLGSDLASKLDLSATVKVFRRDLDGGKPHYYCFTRTYLPEDRVNDAANQHYQRWAAAGHLTGTPGSSIDYAVIEADTIRDIERFQVRELAYDARYADQYAQRVSEQTDVPRVLTPPSPAELSPAMKELEAAVYDGRFHHDANPVLTWCMSNVMTRETAAGNYTMPDKQRPDNKIDAAVALFVAMTRARRAEITMSESVYETQGIFML